MGTALAVFLRVNDEKECRGQEVAIVNTFSSLAFRKGDSQRGQGRKPAASRIDSRETDSLSNRQVVLTCLQPR